jgi:hypothetical protein
MKTNYDFPYQFLDLTNSGNLYVEYIAEVDKLSLEIDLSDFQFIENVDVILEIESSQTFYRKLYILAREKKTVKIDYLELGSKVEYSILLVSKEEGYIEINGQVDYHEKGDCIGVLEKEIIRIIDEEGFSGLIKIAPTIKDKISYDLTSDWITIEIPEVTYEKFYNWQKDDRTNPFALACIGAPCIQFAIIKTLKNEEYIEKKWWESISKLLTDSGYSVYDLDEDDVPGATNIILGNCFQEMVNAVTPELDVEDTLLLA